MTAPWARTAATTAAAAASTSATAPCGSTPSSGSISGVVANPHSVSPASPTTGFGSLLGPWSRTGAEGARWTVNQRWWR
jgi:hypothetical protein